MDPSHACGHLSLAISEFIVVWAFKVSRASTVFEPRDIMGEWKRRWESTFRNTQGVSTRIHSMHAC